MSVTPLDDVKSLLRIVHSHDDWAIQMLIESSESEICRFLGRSQLPTLPQDYPSDESPEVVATPDNVAPEVLPAVCLLVRSKFEDDTVADIAGLRRAAQDMVMPYRIGIGA